MWRPRLACKASPSASTVSRNFSLLSGYAWALTPHHAQCVHPASIRSEVLPRPDEPPPAEGYLAALAREKKIDLKLVDKAVADLGINPDKANPAIS